MARLGRPYAAFVSLINTHNPKGLLSRGCDGNPDDFRDIISCNDKVVSEFAAWYRKTDPGAAILIFGDHQAYPNGLEDILDGLAVRPLFNAIINGPKTKTPENRRLLAYDLMPTILEMAGAVVPGGRLGLGTSLFSGRPTLIEEMGLEKLQVLQTSPNKLYETLM
jgi:phosphoglycerol transferase